MTTLTVIVVFLVGSFMGYLFGVTWTKGQTPPTIGRLVIDESEDDEGQRLFMEVDSGCLRYVVSGKSVILDVTHRNYISRD